MSWECPEYLKRNSPGAQVNVLKTMQNVQNIWNKYLKCNTCPVMWVDDQNHKVSARAFTNRTVHSEGAGVPLRVSLSMLLMEGLEFLGCLGFALPCFLKLLNHCNDPVKAVRTESEFIELVSMKSLISDKINEIANGKVGWCMIGGSILLCAKE